MATQPISAQKRTRIKELAAQGHSRPTIAKLAGVGYGTVDKYVNVDAARLHPLAQFKDHLSDLLHESLMSSMRLQSNLLISLDGEDVDSIPRVEKKELLKVTNSIVGTLYDKTRLQDGKSTVNKSHRIVLDQAHRQRPWSSTSSGVVEEQVTPTKGETCGIMPSVDAGVSIPQVDQHQQENDCT